MEKNNRTFLRAMKLWLIWNLLMNASWVPFVLALITPFFLMSGSLGYVTYRELLWMMFPILLPCLVIASLMIGVIQWFAFMGRVKHSYLWIGATALGWSLAGILLSIYRFTSIDVLPPMDFYSIQRSILVGATAGMVIGLLQWLVIWRQVRGSGWWILGSVLGWASIGCVMYLQILTEIECALAPGLLSMGMITGVAYAYLFTQPVQDRSNKENALRTT